LKEPVSKIRFGIFEIYRYANIITPKVILSNVSYEFCSYYLHGVYGSCALPYLLLVFFEVPFFIYECSPSAKSVFNIGLIALSSVNNENIARCHMLQEAKDKIRNYYSPYLAPAGLHLLEALNNSLQSHFSCVKAAKNYSKKSSRYRQKFLPRCN
jgi:hypothetical protein